jgi:hypothetical protein
MLINIAQFKEFGLRLARTIREVHAKRRAAHKPPFWFICSLPGVFV